MFMMRVFLNSEIFFSRFDFWFWVLVVEHAFIFAVYFLAKKFIPVTPPWLVVLSSLVIGIIRTLITTNMALMAELEPGIDWWLQLTTGALFELVMVSVWANVNGAYREHQEIVRQLNKAKNAILGYRENAEVILIEEQEKLQQLTRESLLPQIQLIENAIEAGNLGLSSRWGVAQELKSLINNQVRPLSESLRQAAKMLVKPAPKVPNQVASVLAIPKRFSITNSIFPTVTSITLLLGFVSAPLWILDQSWTWVSLLLLMPYFVILDRLKKLTSEWRQVNSWLGVPILVIFSVVPMLPAYITALVFYPDARQAALYASTVSFLSLIVILSFALLDSFDYRSRAYRQILIEQNRELTVETTLFEQQLWAARRNWSLVIHGTVQAALTAALTRLNSNDADQSTLDLAKKDLDRAITALTNPQTTDIKFTAAIKELIATWQGVCDIEFEISPELKKTISKDARLSMCVNEIAKEAVSNAVRHGDARNANISLEVSEAGLIALQVTNDGRPPKNGKRKGLGSLMLDELTVDWQLSVDENRDQTVLLAHLPFSKPQA
jgi:two-component sensor histidine kinase